jgi:LmbE family N-acetylglucosaminyl deacetylase
VRGIGFLLLIFLVIEIGRSENEAIVPDTGQIALHQRLVEMRGHFNTLVVAVRPGCEDASLLSYLRLERGSAVTTVFVTNGEAGESDEAFLEPPALATTRRREATAAMSLVDVDSYFLNLPDIAAAENFESVVRFWNVDTLRTRLLGAILKSKPDLVVLCADPFMQGNQSTVEMLQSTIAGLVRDLSSDSAVANNPRITQRWRIHRFLFPDTSGRGLTVARTARHAILRESYDAIGARLENTYASLRVQRRNWDNVRKSYRSERAHSPAIKSIDEGLPLSVSRNVAPLAAKITGLITQEARLRRSPKVSLRLISALLTSIDSSLNKPATFGASTRRDLINWRGELERLRVILLGINVRFSLSETLLTERQLFYFAIDSIAGNVGPGRTQLFFPLVGKGWILNEALESKLPLSVGEKYRIISPESVEYDYPYYSPAYAKSSDGMDLYFFIVHMAEKSEESFVYRIVRRVYFGPRLEVSVSPALCRLGPQTRLFLSLRNNTRDGVADTIRVAEPFVSSGPVAFRLPFKGATWTGTMNLTWIDTVAGGTKIVPVRFGKDPVVYFGARKFDVAVDTALTVGVITPFSSGPAEQALRSLGFRDVKRISTDGITGELPRGLSTIVIDRRALSYIDSPALLYSGLEVFAKAGGRIVFFSQEPSVWNTSPFGNLFRTLPETSLGPEAPLRFDSSHTDDKYLSNSFFDGWLFTRAHARVGAESPTVFPVVTDNSGHSLVASIAFAGSTLTYVGLALEPQILNVNPGALRLLSAILQR